MKSQATRLTTLNEQSRSRQARWMAPFALLALVLFANAAAELIAPSKAQALVGGIMVNGYIPKAQVR